MAKKKSVKLSDIQLAIMRVLWKRGEASTPEVAEALRDERGLAYTTVATLLRRLEKRGVVSHVTRQRALVFKPRVSEAEVKRSMVLDMVGTLFQGDSKALLAHLVREEDIRADDFEKIKKLLEEGQGT